jgi:hypothetical protein
MVARSYEKAQDELRLSPKTRGRKMKSEPFLSFFYFESLFPAQVTESTRIVHQLLANYMLCGSDSAPKVISRETETIHHVKQIFT